MCLLSLRVGVCVLKEIWAYWQIPTEDFSRQAFQRVHTLRLLRYFIVFKEGIYPSFKKHKTQNLTSGKLFGSLFYLGCPVRRGSET